MPARVTLWGVADHSILLWKNLSREIRVSNFEQPVATKERMFLSIRPGSAAPPIPRHPCRLVQA